MKRIFIVIILLISTLQANAVLKEKDLSHTLSILRSELELNEKELNKDMVRFDTIQLRYWRSLLETIKDSEKMSLVLYSQKTEYIFDLAYACREISNVYNEFTSSQFPFEEWLAQYNSEIERYDGLIATLQNMHENVLTPKNIADRDRCLEIALKLREMTLQQREKLDISASYYDKIRLRLKKQKDYVENRYEDIRRQVFVNNGRPYSTILKHWTRHVREAENSYNDKYGRRNQSHSEWRGPIVKMLFEGITFFFLIVSAIAFAVLHWLVPKRVRTPEFVGKRNYYAIASSMFLFSLVEIVFLIFFVRHNFFIMATRQLIEFSWLVGIILLSSLIRMKATQIRSGFMLYLPIILIGAMVISLRIIMAPTEVIDLILPPFLILMAVIQLFISLRHSKVVPRSDVAYSWISFAVIAATAITAWVGYRLLSVQMLTLWLIALSIIQTITCTKHFMDKYERRHIKDRTDYRQTWFFDLMNKTIIPTLVVWCILISVYWAAHIFDMTEWFETQYYSNFIDIDNVAKISVYKLTLVICIGFIVNYCIYITKAILRDIYNDRHNNGMIMLALNIGTIVVWTIYVIASLLILSINNSGVIVAIGGMSTGIGFALKDTIENLFYGISLMTGRVKVGDMIECDGIRGKIANVNFQSTMIETLDGSVIAFLNSQLFTKNFKNLTRNHGSELCRIPVGVAYGTNVAQAREVILNELSKIVALDQKRGYSVILDKFGDSSVDLQVVVWIPVDAKLQTVSQIQEAIYNAFNANNISIPFPQQDIYIHNTNKE